MSMIYFVTKFVEPGGSRGPRCHVIITLLYISFKMTKDIVKITNLLLVSKQE